MGTIQRCLHTVILCVHTALTYRVTLFSLIRCEYRLAHCVCGVFIVPACTRYQLFSVFVHVISLLCSQIFILRPQLCSYAQLLSEHYRILSTALYIGIISLAVLHVYICTLYTLVPQLHLLGGFYDPFSVCIVRCYILSHKW